MGVVCDDGGGAGGQPLRRWPNMGHPKRSRLKRFAVSRAQKKPFQMERLFADACVARDARKSPETSFRSTITNRFSPVSVQNVVDGWSAWHVAGAVELVATSGRTAK
jgi:hypothetical protein